MSKTTSFDKQLAELDKLVENMESGELDLENNLKQYEKGIKLIRQCQTQLQQAEQKVKILSGSDDAATLQDFNTEE